VSVSGLTRVKVCAEGGDSGGSFITGAGQAQGVLSGGNYSCKGNQAALARATSSRSAKSCKVTD
jgi:streptogrisin C